MTSRGLAGAETNAPCAAVAGQSRLQAKATRIQPACNRVTNLSRVIVRLRMRNTGSARRSFRGVPTQLRPHGLAGASCSPERRHTLAGSDVCAWGRRPRDEQVGTEARGGRDACRQFGGDADESRGHGPGGRMSHGADQLIRDPSPARLPKHRQEFPRTATADAPPPDVVAAPVMVPPVDDAHKVPPSCER